LVALKKFSYHSRMAVPRTAAHRTRVGIAKCCHGINFYGRLPTHAWRRPLPGGFDDEHGRYALTFGSMLLAGGRLADLLGRRRLPVIGLITFALASLGCGLARWPVMLIVARLVQGGA
jgi:hypothetical protein